MRGCRTGTACQQNGLKNTGKCNVLFDFSDRYLKKHSFCDECTKMVNKAYTLLVEDEDSCPSDRHGSPTCDGKENGCNAVSSSNIDDEKKISKIYSGLTTCVSDKHVHVECKEEVVAHLVEMAEPELSGLRQERHAKTIEIAQKEVLTCIGKSFSQCVSKYHKMTLIKPFHFRHLLVRKVPANPTKTP